MGPLRHFDPSQEELQKATVRAVNPKRGGFRYFKPRHHAGAFVFLEIGMPGMCFGSFDRDFGKRAAAWTAHYERKGCSSTKAQAVAWKKCRKGFTWPPEGDGA